MSRTSLSRKMRLRRDRIEFERALRNASPAMRQELIAAAAHHSLIG